MSGKKTLTILVVVMAALAFGVGTAFANLITNGGFESGNTGFTSAYTYYDVPASPDDEYGAPLGLYDEKTYGVGTNPSLYHVSWASFGANTGSNMMIVNGSTDVGTNVWASPDGATYAVTSNTWYNFSAYLTSVYPAAGQAPTNPATLAFSIAGNISGTQLGADFQLAANVGAWELFNESWFSGSNTSVVLSLVNRNTKVDGNDFAIDDIVFDTNVPALPEPSTLLLLGSGLLGLVGYGRMRLKK